MLYSTIDRKLENTLNGRNGEVKQRCGLVRHAALLKGLEQLRSVSGPLGGYKVSDSGKEKQVIENSILHKAQHWCQCAYHMLLA